MIMQTTAVEFNQLMHSAEDSRRFPHPASQTEVRFIRHIPTLIGTDIEIAFGKLGHRPILSHVG